MDFIERIFHIWPDHGDGTFEALIFAILATLIACAVVRTVSANRRSHGGRAMDWKLRRANIRSAAAS